MKSLQSLPKLPFALWMIFVGGNILLVLLNLAPSGFMMLAAFLLMILLLIEVALLIVYRRFVAQWRSILLLGVLYTLMRWGAGSAHRQQWLLLETLAMMIALYAMFAAWGAMIALSFSRDVSVAYLVIFIVFAPVLMRATLMQSGGVLALLQTNEAGGSPESFSLSEPLMMGLSCLPGLALVTFVPHFLWLWYEEWGRTPLVKESE